MGSRRLVSTWPDAPRVGLYQIGLEVGRETLKRLELAEGTGDASIPVEPAQSRLFERRFQVHRARKKKVKGLSCHFLRGRRAGEQ